MTVQFGDTRLPSRFWGKVAISYYPNQNPDLDKCWEWIAACDHNGYGAFRWDGKMVLAHRFAYQELVSPIADGLECDHQCWVRCCVNPNHIRLATRKENMENMSTTGRAAISDNSKLNAGEAHSASKLTNEQVLEIREMYSAGRCTQMDLAQMFGVSRSLVGFVVNRKTWKHI